jgi:type IV pilus assembly protein PilX
MSLAMTTSRAIRLPARPSAPRRAQGGIVLFISLIVLVAMTMAGIALMRSVDTSVVVSGNMAFKQSAISVADRGTAVAVQWLQTNSAGVGLYDTIPAAGYYANKPAAVADPDWFDIASWNDAFLVNGGAPDAAGNVVRYVIHRMCEGTGSSTGTTCGLYYGVSTAASGGSMAVGSPVFLGTPQLYYRITTRVDGPRDTVSVIQTSVLIGT